MQMKNRKTVPANIHQLRYRSDDLRAYGAWATEGSTLMRLHSRRARTGFVLLLTLLMVSGSLAPLASRAEKPGSAAYPASAVTLMEPVKNRLSGPSWIFASGLDPRVSATRPKLNPILGRDWSTVSSVGSGGLAGGSAQQVPFRDPAPGFSRNLIVTRQLGLFPIQTEPHIAVDPNDPDHLVLGVIDYNFPAMSTYLSWDGGETWEGPQQVRYFREDFTAAGDPVLAFDHESNVFITSISLGFEGFKLGSLKSDAEVSSMVVAKSTDGGYTWSEPVSAARSEIVTESNVDETGRERGTVTLPFLDKPWLAVGPNPADPDASSLYLTYSEFRTTYSLVYSDELAFLSAPYTESVIRVTRSDDGGLTWTKPNSVSPVVLQAEGSREPGMDGPGASEGFELLQENYPGLSNEVLQAEGIDPETAAVHGDGVGGVWTQQDTATEPDSSNRTVQGSQPTVLPDGTLAVVYVDTTNDGIQDGMMTIMAVLSKDGGETLSEPVVIGVFREPHYRPRNASFRYWGTAFPQLASGPNGEIYVAVTGLPGDKVGDDGDIYLMRSLNGGEAWEEPARINTDSTNRVQFFPAVDVSPNGTVHLMWADMRDDPDEVRYHIYYSRSEDQGETFGFTLEDESFTAPDTRVTDFASNSLRGFPNGLFIGDYFSLAANDEDVYMVWTDTRLGEYGGPSEQVAFARQRALPNPELFLNPPSGAAGRTVDIQGFGFQTESNLLIQVSGVTVASERTNDKGEFQTRIYMPITGEGPQEIRVFDETGNVATASFYTEFGFDSIQNILQPDGPDPTPVPVASPTP